MKIEKILLLISLMTATGSENSSEEGEWVQSYHYSALAYTDLVLAFVVFRNGNRTPGEEELALVSTKNVTWEDALFPYGPNALTNMGKQRSYFIGKYLRGRYDRLISNIYLPDEIDIRTTDYAVTKMTALTVLSALYPPEPVQQWNYYLDWQPVPYNTLPKDDDDLLYWNNCPRYSALRNKIYEDPEIKEKLQSYKIVFQTLSTKMGSNITTPRDVLLLDNLLQSIKHVGFSLPKWATNVMPQIKELTKMEFFCENFNEELIRLSAGVLLSEIMNATSTATCYDEDVKPKLRLYSAHEYNVAALMAAVGVFKPHHPRFGATFSLELRIHKRTGQYLMAAVYSPIGGAPASILPIPGCGGSILCNYDDFSNLVEQIALSKKQYVEACSVVDV